MDTTYYVIYGMLLLLSVFGLVVGVSNDACNFLNSSIGSRAGTYTGAVAVAAVGVLLGASFSSGMMEIARRGVFTHFLPARLGPGHGLLQHRQRPRLPG